jgi:hypothetical protein
VENWLWKRLWACRKADSRVVEGTLEDIRRSIRRRTKGENGKIE